MMFFYKNKQTIFYEHKASNGQQLETLAKSKKKAFKSLKYLY